MKQIIFIIIGLFSILNCKSQNSIENQKTIHEIDSIRQKFHIPGLVFGVATTDKTLLSGALGIREINTKDSVTIKDLFHIASLGKGFTSFIAGKLVDEGKISWNTRFFSFFRR